MTYYGIYKITNLLNGKMYIGRHKTTNLDDGYMGSGVHISRAIKKYGVENFRKEWLMFCEDEEEMNYMERVFVDQTWVERSDTYNIDIGGNYRFNYKPSNETKMKTSYSLKGENNGFFGKHHSNELKNHWSQMKKGKSMNLSPETRIKYSKRTTQKNTNRHWFTNGIKNVFTYVCPKGFTKGMMHFNKKEGTK